jgi:hypothetical protein
VHDRPSRVAERDGVAQRVDREVAGHASTDRVAHQALGAGVLDRAEVELALGGRVFSDVGEPDLVRVLGGEVSLQQIVVHRRSRDTSRAALPAVTAEEPLLGAEPVHAVPAGHHTLLSELVSDEPVAELGVVVMDLAGQVDQVRVVPVPLRDRVSAPLVERLLGEAQHPAGHRDGDVVGGEVKDQRVHHFGSTSRAK